MKFSMKQFLSDNKCLVIMLSLLAILIIEPLQTHESWYFSYLIMVYYLFMIISPYILTGKRKVLLLCLIIGALGMSGKLMLPDSPDSIIGLYLSWMLVAFDVFLTMSVVLYSCSKTSSTREPVMGSILAYLLIGVCFADIYSIINHLNPNSFTSEASDIHLRDFLYFSYTTLTTLGLGDIIPKSPLARRLVSLEAVAGVLYVAVFIGRIIALFTSAQILVQNEKQIESMKIHKIQH